MSRSRSLGVVLLVMMTLVSSCATPASTVIPAITQTSPPPPLPTETFAPTIEPTIAASPTPAVTAPATPGGPALYLPIGLACVPSAGVLVDYYDFQGQKLGELQSPNLGTGLYQQAHLAGPLTYSPSPVLPPLVFYAFDNGGELWLNSGGDLSLIKAEPNLFSLVGIPGQPTLAFSLPQYTDAGVRSLVYIGDAQSLPTSDPVLDSTNSMSYAVKLLAVASVDSQPAGIWYTTVPYGIGGDIVYEPRSGLYYLDLSALTINNYLDLTKRPAGFSYDQSWVAYEPNNGNGPLSIVHNFESSTTISYPMREDSNRGAGDAVFSPDNAYVAWREAGGSLMDQPSTFHQTIRIASVNGTIITEIPDSSLLNAAGFSGIGSAIPVGWLDTQTLVLEVKDMSGTQSIILKVNLDGTGLASLASGSFLGFLYP